MSVKDNKLEDVTKKGNEFILKTRSCQLTDPRNTINNSYTNKQQSSENRQYFNMYIKIKRQSSEF